MALADRTMLKAPVTLADEAEAARPAVFTLEDADFLAGQSVPRLRTGKPQAIFDAVRTLMRADRFDKGCVAVMGHTDPARMRAYKDDLGRRRAEAVKACIAGDAERARMIFERLFRAEHIERVRGRWLHDEANELLELVSPDVPVEGHARIYRLQGEAGLRPDGLPARETWAVLIEELANQLSLARWVIPNKIYTAISVPSHEHGKVELWVWPSSPPPEGSMASWQARGPVRPAVAPPAPPSPPASAEAAAAMAGGAPAPAAASAAATGAATGAGVAPAS